jgi:hypothetical protein
MLYDLSTLQELIPEAIPVRTSYFQQTCGYLMFKNDIHITVLALILYVNAYSCMCIEDELKLVIAPCFPMVHRLQPPLDFHV